MPAKSGASHASAALISVILGAMISGYIKVYAEPVARVTEGIGTFVATQADLPLSEEMSGILVVVAVLSFLWGVAYHMARY